MSERIPHIFGIDTVNLDHEIFVVKDHEHLIVRALAMAFIPPSHHNPQHFRGTKSWSLRPPLYSFQHFD